MADETEWEVADRWIGYLNDELNRTLHDDPRRARLQVAKAALENLIEPKGTWERLLEEIDRPT